VRTLSRRESIGDGGPHPGATRKQSAEKEVAGDEESLDPPMVSSFTFVGNTAIPATEVSDRQEFIASSRPGLPEAYTPSSGGQALAGAKPYGTQDQGNATEARGGEAARAPQRSLPSLGL